MVNGLADLIGDNSMAEFSGIVSRSLRSDAPRKRNKAGGSSRTGRSEISEGSGRERLRPHKKYTGEDISNHDIHVHSSVSRGHGGDSASNLRRDGRHQCPRGSPGQPGRRDDGLP